MGFLKLWLILLPCLSILLPCLSILLPCLSILLPYFSILLYCLSILLPCLSTLLACLNKFYGQHCNLLLSKYKKSFNPYLSFTLRFILIDVIHSFLIVIAILKECVVVAMNCHS